MPLPNGNTKWPPEPWDAAYATFATWDAWYSGDPDRLAAAYGGAYGGLARDFFRPSQYAGGVVGKVARWFWGQPTPSGERPSKLHVPIAGDIASTSADLLFAEPPTFTVDDQTAQARIDELADDGMHATLLEAAEIAAALGGVFLRVTWDRETADRPFLSAVHTDAAVPEFRWGRLYAVTFWSIVADDGHLVLRHLERHEPGVILHGLYQGTRDTLGQPVPLNQAADTAAFAELVDEQGAIPTGVDNLTAAYVPNMRPNRAWRSRPALAHLGRSDYAGVEPMMDALDETYTSWLRDIRLGKARIIMPEQYLNSEGPGQGASVDLDREVYVGINALNRPGDALSITPQQFAIRYAEHRDTAADYLQRIVSGAGYSGQTFGENSDGAALTATEVHARERRSYITRDKKIRYWRPALVGLMETLLAVDAQVFGSGVTPARPEVEFGEHVQEQPLTLAETAQAMRNAEAASTQTVVQLLHPDWDDDAVQEEVDRIDSENEPPPVPDPNEFGRPAQPGEQPPDDEE